MQAFCEQWFKAGTKETTITADETLQMGSNYLRRGIYTVYDKDGKEMDKGK